MLVSRHRRHPRPGSLFDADQGRTLARRRVVRVWSAIAQLGSDKSERFEATSFRKHKGHPRGVLQAAVPGLMADLHNCSTTTRLPRNAEDVTTHSRCRRGSRTLLTPRSTPWQNSCHLGVRNRPDGGAGLGRGPGHHPSHIPPPRPCALDAHGGRNDVAVPGFAGRAAPRTGRLALAHT